MRNSRLPLPKIPHNNMYSDIIIIGGGASGLAAACEASGCGCTVTLLEKNPRVGKKLLITGNGRCNLGNENIGSESFHGDYSAFSEAIAAFDVRRFFERAGLYCVADSEGRLYPRSNAAASVLDALRFRAENRVGFVCGCTASDIIPKKDGFDVVTQNGVFSCSALIIAAGGSAAPATGSDGYAEHAARRLGHSPVKATPSLCRIKTDPALLRGLKGQRAAGTVRLMRDGKPMREQSGEIQFTDSAVSGICALNVSRQAGISPCGLELSLDFAPDIGKDRLAAMLTDIFRLRSALAPEELLTGILPKRVGMAVMRGIDIAAGAEGRVAARIKDFRLPVLGSGGWQETQVTAGGIPAQQLDAGLQSLYHRGLFFAGECVNIDGDCGGFNLHWAWTSGCLAAASAIKLLGETRKTHNKPHNNI